MWFYRARRPDRRLRARAVRASTARRRIVARLAVVCVMGAPLALAGSCSRPKDNAIPVDPKGRSDFLGAAADKLGPEERRLLTRFGSRLDEREANGDHNFSPEITIPRAVELQRDYEAKIAQAQVALQDKLLASQTAIRVEIKDAQVVKGDRALPAADPRLRFVVNVTNRSKKVIDHIALRIEVRESSGKYQAAIPNLQLGGPLRPGEAGRSVQLLPLDAQRHEYILQGRPVQIIAMPLQITYADGDKVDPGTDLKTLESLHTARIE
jgi:hypothetical protein